MSRVKNLAGGWAAPVEAKTSAYSLTAFDCGKVFSNFGAVGSVTFTLPVTSAELVGFNCEFITEAAQPLVIATNPTDTLVIHADVAADSVTTASTIGQHFRVICTAATRFFVISDPSAASAATAVTAVTIAT